MGLTSKRLLSYAFFSIGWLVSGVKLTLDVIGWSTAPEDTSVALGRSMLLLNWLASLPSWIPDVSAIALTMWLMFMSWPRAQTTNAVGNQSAALNLAPVTSSSTPVKILFSIHYDISTAGTKVNREIERFPGSGSMGMPTRSRFDAETACLSEPSQCDEDEAHAAGTVPGRDRVG